MDLFNNSDDAGRSSRPWFLPVALIVLILIGNILFCITSVLPHWITHEDLAAQVQAQKDTINTQVAEQDEDTDTVVLEQQVTNAQERLNKIANVFLNDTQVEGVIDRLYAYAAESETEIISVQSHAGEANATNDAYAIRILRLELNGTMPNLIRFMTLIRESSIPSGIVENLNVNQTDNKQGVLTMDLVIYTSPYSSGEIVAGLLASPTPMPTATDTSTPTATPIPPTETPATPTNTPTITPSPTVTITPSATATFTASPIPPTDTPTVTYTPVPPSETPVTPTETLTPEPTATISATEAALSIPFTDDFETDLLYVWDISPAWSLVSSEDGHALETSAANDPARFIYSPLKNMAVQARVQPTDGAVQLSVRENNAEHYAAVLSSEGEIALYRSGQLVESDMISPSDAGEWHTLRISAIDEIVRVSVDGEEYIVFSDAESLPAGGLSFSLVGNGILRVDDFKLWFDID